MTANQKLDYALSRLLDTSNNDNSIYKSLGSIATDEISMVEAETILEFTS